MKIVQLQSVRPDGVNMGWLSHVFTAKAAQTGGVVRRAIRDVEREVGRDVFVQEVADRGFHLIECGGQFIVICRKDHVIVHV